MSRMIHALKAAALATAAVTSTAAQAQLFLTTPNLKEGRIEGSDPLVGLPIPGATAAEYRAHLLWNLRSGLNVAALQCQFSDYLRAVPNYNGLLAHHSEELAVAYTTLNGYFKRTLGAQKGQKAFDDYSTITYNNFSTLQAQMIFCQTATNIVKTALATPKGKLLDVAQTRMRELRNSLVPAYERPAVYNPWLVRLSPLPPLDEACWTKRNVLRVRCGGTG
ncbi:MAG TPA: hypothetical protein VGB59_12255 [Allosphingosinicella sp.]|jgi:hypothetical protein